MDAVGVVIVVDLELRSVGRVGNDNDLEAGEDFGREALCLEHINRDVSVEFTKSIDGGLVSWLSNVALSKEELRA